MKPSPDSKLITQGCFVLSKVDNGPVVVKSKIFKTVIVLNSFVIVLNSFVFVLISFAIVLISFVIVLNLSLWIQMWPKLNPSQKLKMTDWFWTKNNYYIFSMKF